MNTTDLEALTEIWTILLGISQQLSTEISHSEIHIISSLLSSGVCAVWNISFAFKPFTTWFCLGWCISFLSLWFELYLQYLTIHLLCASALYCISWSLSSLVQQTTLWHSSYSIGLYYSWFTKTVAKSNSFSPLYTTALDKVLSKGPEVCIWKKEKRFITSLNLTLHTDSLNQEFPVLQG